MKLQGLPLLALIVLSLMWGYAWTIIKLGLIDAGPFSFAAMRMMLAAVCLLLVLPVTGRAFLPRRIPELIALGLVQTTALFGFSMWALAEGSAGRVAFLVYTMPFMTLLLAWPLLGERIRGRQWLGVVLAACGLTAILQPWNMSGAIASKLLALGGGAAWAVSAIMVKQLQKRGPMDLISMTAWQMFFGAIPLVFLAWFIGEPAIVWSGRFIVVLLVVSLVMTASGWLLWVYALNHLPAGTAGMGTLAAPVVAVLSSSFHLGERPDPIEIAGMILIFAALMILTLNAVRQHRELTLVAGQG